MIFARATTDTGQMLLIGLSRANVNQLIAGRPIKITKANQGEAIPPGWEISIMFGETEQAMAAELQAVGAIGPDTKVNVDPRLGGIPL